jgi:nudix motif 8
MMNTFSVSARLDIKTRLNQLDLRTLKREGERSASVLVPLCNVNKEASVLFTKRSDTVGTHKGQVSFPGGMADEADPNGIATALRETEEEIGFPVDQVEVLGCFHEARAITGVHVLPVIGFLPGLESIEDLKANQDEIDAIFTIGLADLVNPQKRYRQQLGPKTRAFVFDAGPFPVWGLTAYILEQVLRDALGISLSSKVESTDS